MTEEQLKREISDLELKLFIKEEELSSIMKKLATIDKNIDDYEFRPKAPKKTDTKLQIEKINAQLASINAKIESLDKTKKEKIKSAEHICKRLGVEIGTVLAIVGCATIIPNQEFFFDLFFTPISTAVVVLGSYGISILGAEVASDKIKSNTIKNYNEIMKEKKYKARRNELEMERSLIEIESLGPKDREFYELEKTNKNKELEKCMLEVEKLKREIQSKNDMLKNLSISEQSQNKSEAIDYIPNSIYYNEEYMQSNYDNNNKRKKR